MVGIAERGDRATLEATQVEQLRQAQANIAKYLGQLTVTHKLLVGCLVVIMVMVLFLVTQYAGSPAMRELLPGAPAEAQQRAVEFLRTSGAPHRIGGDGAVMVPADRHPAIFAQMAQAGGLPDDKTILFHNLVENQPWTLSRDQQRQVSNIALQNELARWLREFDGISKAIVLIDVPETVGIGGPSRKPTASVTVWPTHGSPLDQKMVDAIANFVAGSRAGLEAANVRIIDGSTGTQRSATSTDNLIPMTYREYQAAFEADLKKKIESLILHIPGAYAAVTAQVDVTRQSVQTERYLAKDEGTVSLPSRDSTRESEDSRETRAAEPGLRSNVTSDIMTGGSSGGTRSTQNEAETDFETRFGKRVEQVVDPRGMPTYLAATVLIPENYIVGILRKEAARAAGGGGDPPEPTVDEINQRFERERAAIEESIAPHLTVSRALPDGETSQARGEVKVSMIPVEGPGAFGNGAAAGLLGGGLSFGGGLGGSLIDKVVLGALAVVALAMMLMMVRKAGKRTQLPTAEELVGIPPTLATNSNLVGEAEEGDSPMAGIELDDEQLRASKMLEQVGDMVQTNPADAAKLVGRWLTKES